MNISVSTTRNGYVYATAPFKFGRFEQTDIFFVQVPLVLTNILFGIDPLVGFYIGLMVLTLYKRFTRDTLPGHLYLVLSNKISALAVHPKYSRYPTVKYIAQTIAQLWKRSGSLSPPTFRYLHER